MGYFQPQSCHSAYFALPFRNAYVFVCHESFFLSFFLSFSIDCDIAKWAVAVTVVIVVGIVVVLLTQHRSGNFFMDTVSDLCGNPGDEITRSNIDDVIQVGEEAVLEAIIVAVAVVAVAAVVAAPIAVILSRSATSQRCHSLEEANFFSGKDWTKSNLKMIRKLRKLIEKKRRSCCL